MKKARTIKIIKSGSPRPVQTVTPPEEISEPKNEKLCPVQIIKSWVSEHHEQKLMAEQVALKLLYNSSRPSKINDKFSMP